MDGLFFDGPGARRPGWLAAAVRGLHALSCGVWSPALEVSDSARAAIILSVFGLAGAALAQTPGSRPLSWAYVALGTSRLPWRGRGPAAAAAGLAAAAAAVAAEAWLAPGCVALAVALSELCWLPTASRALERNFVACVSLLFALLCMLLTFGVYPLLLRWAPMLLARSRVVGSVVGEVAAQAGGADDGRAGPRPFGGGASLGEPEQSGALLAAARAAPLLALLGCVPLLACVTLAYCWICQRASWLLPTIVCAFVAWLLLFVQFRATLPPDALGKAMLCSVCVLMHHALSGLAAEEAAEVRRRRLAKVALAFGSVFALDRVAWALGGSGAEGLLLLLVLFAFKLLLAALAEDRDLAAFARAWPFAQRSGGRRWADSGLAELAVDMTSTEEAVAADER